MDGCYFFVALLGLGSCFLALLGLERAAVGALMSGTAGLEVVCLSLLLPSLTACPRSCSQSNVLGGACHGRGVEDFSGDSCVSTCSSDSHRMALRCCCREGMSRQEAEDLVATALALAMSRDGSSGGVIRCAAFKLAACCTPAPSMHAVVGSGA